MIDIVKLNKLRRKARHYFRANLLSDVEEVSTYSQASAILLGLKLISEQEHSQYPFHINYGTFDDLERYFTWKDNQFYKSPIFKLKKDYNSWLEFRRNFISLKIKSGEEIKCHYCGLTDLVIETKNDARGDNCTLDHIIPLSQGGKRFSEKNIVLSCYSCNNNKGSRNYDDFVSGKWLKKRITNVLTNPDIKSKMI